MFNSKKKKPVIESVKSRFIIPQVEDSLAGLKTSRGTFKKSEFASSLYGSGIKDVSTYHDNSELGIDVRRTYDNYRTKENKKISDEDLIKKYGTKFPEFQQINLDTAKEIYGEAITVKKVGHQKQKEKPVSFSFIQDRQAYEKEEPMLKEDDNKPEDNEGFVFDFDKEVENTFVDDDKSDSFEALHPTIEITDDEDEFFNTPKQTSFTNIVKRTREEMAEVKKQGTPFIEKNNIDEEMILVEDDDEKVNDQKDLPKQESLNDKIPQSVNPYKNYQLPPIDKFKRTPESEEELPQWVTE